MLQQERWGSRELRVGARQQLSAWQSAPSDPSILAQFGQGAPPPGGFAPVLLPRGRSCGTSRDLGAAVYGQRFCGHCLI